MSRTSLMVLIVSLVGCAATPPPITRDAGTGPAETPAYWGFADQTCWRYDDGSGLRLFTISVAQDTTAVAGQTTWHLMFRQNGLPAREDYLQVSNDTLLDWRHVDWPSGNKPQVYTEYSPPPVLLKADLPTGQPASTMTMAMESSTDSTGNTMNMTVPLSFIVTNGGTSMISAMGSSYDATQYVVTVAQPDGSNATADNFWFMQNIGIVQVQLSSQTTPWTLAKIDLNTPSTGCTP